MLVAWQEVQIALFVSIENQLYFKNPQFLLRIYWLHTYLSYLFQCKDSLLTNLNSCLPKNGATLFFTKLRSVIMFVNRIIWWFSGCRHACRLVGGMERCDLSQQEDLLQASQRLCLTLKLDVHMLPMNPLKKCINRCVFIRMRSWNI